MWEEVASPPADSHEREDVLCHGSSVGGRGRAPQDSVYRLRSLSRAEHGAAVAARAPDPSCGHGPVSASGQRRDVTSRGSDHS